MFVGLVCIVLFCDLTTSNNYYTNIECFMHEARGAIISILLKKILTLSQYTVSKKEIGKLTNLLSNDFNLIEEKGSFIFVICTLPLAYGGAATLLIIWLGPEGLICMGVPLVFFPLIGLISKLYEKNLSSMNKYKDERVRVINDMVGLLKQIKIYALEHVFRNIVGNSR